MSVRSDAGFLANLKMGPRIYAGFGLLLVLVLVLGALAWTTARSGEEQLSAFRRQSVIALDSVSAGADTIAMRLAANRFITTGNQQAVDAMQAAANRSASTLEDARVLMDSADDRRVVEDFTALKEQYVRTFMDIVPLRLRQTDIVTRIINSTGAKIRGELTAIRDAGLASGDFDTLALSGRLNADFLLARTVAARFIAQGDPEDFKEVMELLAGVSGGLAALVPIAQTLGVQERVALVAQLLPTYESGFRELDETVSGIKAQAARLDQIGPVLMEKSELIRTAAWDRQTMVSTQAQEGAATARTATLAATLAALALGVAAAWIMARGITRPVVGMTQAMTRLAEGDLSVEIPGVGRGDEIGDMAAAVQVFRTNAMERERLAAAQAADQAAKSRRSEAVDRMIRDFDAKASAMLRTVAAAATELDATARSMAAVAEQTNRQASTVASAAEQTSANVQTVATASEEMSASLHEISQQITRSSGIAAQAVSEADRTNLTVQDLREAAQRVGEVVQLINMIASQTNLLALNATIEAARAGEAGKGFAVVAGEVKGLATQTARATEEIAAQVEAMQSSTAKAVSAIEAIGHTIGEINGITATIAAAVEEQTAATAEIARSVNQAAQGTQEVTVSIGDVTRGASHTGAAATQVLSSAGELAQQAETLRGEVEQFLSAIRAA